MSLDLPADLSTALEHSPRLVIARPTLVPAADSPTGWILVIPADAALADDLAAVLQQMVVDEWPEVDAVLERYRQART